MSQFVQDVEGTSTDGVLGKVDLEEGEGRLSSPRHSMPARRITFADGLAEAGSADSSVGSAGAGGGGGPAGRSPRRSGSSSGLGGGDAAAADAALETAAALGAATDDTTPGGTGCGPDPVGKRSSWDGFKL